MDPRTGDWDIWIIDVARGVPSPIDVRSRSGQRPGVVARRKGNRLRLEPWRDLGLYRKAVDGSSARDARRQDGRCSDGCAERLVARRQIHSLPPGQQEGRSVWALPLFGDRKPFCSWTREFLPMRRASLARRPMAGVRLVRDRTVRGLRAAIPGSRAETTDLQRRRRPSAMDGRRARACVLGRATRHRCRLVRSDRLDVPRRSAPNARPAGGPQPDRHAGPTTTSRGTASGCSSASPQDRSRRD